MLLTLGIKYREISHEWHYTLRPFRRVCIQAFPLFNKLARKYPGCQSFAARVFARPKTSRPATDEAPRRTREKTSGSQGSAEEVLNKQIINVWLTISPWRERRKAYKSENSAGLPATYRAGLRCNSQEINDLLMTTRACPRLISQGDSTRKVIIAHPNRVSCWTIRNLYWLNRALSWEHLHSRHHPSTCAFCPLPLPRCQSQYHWKKKKNICHLSSQELTSLFLGLSWNFTCTKFSF